jgi:peptidoglycan/LPS O-acetylase OafA/YrhL
MLKKKRYKELDSLRGVAALLVVFFHFTMGRDEAALGFRLGTTGVDLFFIISGFVILLSLENVKNYKQFIANRVSRLYPTYWASVSFGFLLLIVISILKNNLDGIGIIPYLGNMTMFQFYLGIGDLDGPYWTMIIEMLFYIVMVSLFHFNFLKYLDVIFIAVSILLVFAANFAFDNIWIKRCFYWIPLLQFLPLFHAGTLFYKIASISVKKRNTKYYILIFICLLCQMFLFNYVGRSRSYINNFEYAIMLVIYFAIFTLFVNDKLSFIINRSALFLGKISFALYLIHQRLSIAIINALQNRFHIDFWIASFVALSCSVTIAVIITELIEIPYSKKMREKLYKVFHISKSRGIIK